MRISIFILALSVMLGAGAPAALGQVAAAEDRPSVLATGQGEASRMPDFATVGFEVRGEGATATAALAALSSARRQIEAGLRSLKGVSEVEISTTDIATRDVRGPDCSAGNRFMADQQLSTGACEIVGVIATSQMEVKTFPVGRAGDVASMAAQLGARSVSLRGSGLMDEGALQAEAAIKAVADARRQALRVATAAGERLGPVLHIQTGANYFPITVTGSRIVAEAMSPPAPAPPPPPPPPLAVPLDYTPQPISKTANVTVTFALEPTIAR